MIVSSVRDYLFNFVKHARLVSHADARGGKHAVRRGDHRGGRYPKTLTLFATVYDYSSMIVARSRFSS